jgi:hypothetical protein
MATTAQKENGIKIPSPHDWRTTDADEINKRRLRAREESFTISNLEPQHPVFSNFRVASGSGLTYSVEIRDVRQRHFACDCVDFRANGLGTCKHVEAVLLHLAARFRRLFNAAQQNGSNRIEVVVDSNADTLRVLNGRGELPDAVKKCFDAKGSLASPDRSGEAALAALRQLREAGFPQIRISQEVAGWLENRRRAAERKQLRREYELKVQSGEWPLHETKVPLFPYQREGMLHLAFTERALLADEMGLGKTIQAIAACALLNRLGKARHALVVTPASLKTEWEEQIQRFTDLPYQILFGARLQRLKAYHRAGQAVQAHGDSRSLAPRRGEGQGEGFPFFTIVNYEQMLTDALDVNARLRPDIIVLDEAQRIKNWNTKTAQAVKRLRSRYAFVLTGTPIENRIDELHSLMDFLNPSALGPLFRFNRDFYELDDRGRPIGYRNLDQLHARIRPYLVRRRKADVETELPERTDRNYFVRLSDEQAARYGDHARIVLRLVNLAKRRPLTKEEQEKLQRELAMMRMICDTNYILDPDNRDCPKLPELEKVLEECRENDAKVIVFSEWERMLHLVRELCERLEFGFAWHTGSVPQRRRRAEINAFKSDPNCRVFLSTDSGSTGLNLQNASVVINCDLPWNPARLEQRIARAWRKHQTRPVTVINLIAENTIEHRMLDTLANKQALADGVLDLKGDLKEIKMRGGRQAFLARLQQLMATTPTESKPETPGSKPALPADRALAFTRRVRDTINGALVCCEERYPNEGAHSVLFVVVDGNPAQHRTRLEGLHAELFGSDRSDPLAPVRLEVIDRPTDEALQRLMAAGLIARTTRASRALFPAEAATASAPLSATERAKADTSRAQSARKLKMAKLLGEGGLDEEARAPLKDSIHNLARALAVENRLPEPASLDDSFLPPLSHCWNEALPLLRSFVAEPSQPWKPVADALDKIAPSRNA